MKVLVCKIDVYESFVEVEVDLDGEYEMINSALEKAAGMPDGAFSRPSLVEGEFVVDSFVPEHATMS